MHFLNVCINVQWDSNIGGVQKLCYKSKYAIITLFLQICHRNDLSEQDPIAWHPYWDDRIGGLYAPWIIHRSFSADNVRTEKRPHAGPFGA